MAKNLRVNSNLAPNEYFVPMMGLIFLRHATNHFYEAKAAIEAGKAAGRMPNRLLVEADFTRRHALKLPESAQSYVILKMPKDGNLGAALNAGMEAIEDDVPPLAGQLPEDHARPTSARVRHLTPGSRTLSADAKRSESPRWR